MEWLSQVISFVKSSKKLMFGVFMVSGIIVFTPPNYLEILCLKNFKSNYGIYMGFSFLGSLILLVMEIFQLTWQKIQEWRKKCDRKHELHKVLNTLDQYEKQVLSWFFTSGTQNTIALPTTNSAVAGLISKGIIHKVGESTNNNIFCSLTKEVVPHITFDGTLHIQD